MSAAPRPYRTPSRTTGSNGIGMPLLARAGGHDIRMTGEAQHRPCAAMPRPEVLDRSERHALDAEAVRLQALRDELQAAVILGADGRTADQFLGEGERRVGVGRQSLEPPEGRPRRVWARSYSEDLRTAASRCCYAQYDSSVRLQPAD